MAENEVMEQSKRKQIRQPPSVPFLWEDRPGIPRKDWKPEKLFANPILVVPSTPVKLFASVPFKWEEKPGRPLPSFLEPSTEPSLLLLPPPANLISFSPSSSCKSHDFNDTNNDNDCESNDYGDDEKDEMFGIDLQSFSFETEDLFISDPSLLAKRLQSSVTISDAVPVKKTQANDVGSSLESLYSSPSESESSSSSYDTGTTGLVGASFLDNLFPLVKPTSGFLDNAGNSENGVLSPLMKKSKDLECNSNCNAVVRRPPTLGELIMMSRRRSCRRKAVQMRKNNLSMNITKKAAFGCWIFGINTNKVGRLQEMIRQPRLKLM